MSDEIRRGSPLFDLRVYLVADPEQASSGLEATVAAALDGGVTAVQLRAKSMTDSESIALARRLKKMCDAAGATFLINDRVDIALAVDAEGVHLGVDDLPLETARRILGPDKVIGFSPEFDQQAEGARNAGADYLGVGPVFGTTSKSDAGQAVGLETLRRRVELAGIPVIGIGGISAGNAPGVMQTGAAGVAVVSAILRAADPRSAAAELRAAVDSTVRSA